MTDAVTDAPRAWTPEEDAQLREYVLQVGLSYAEIGKLMKRTKNQVIGRAHRMGIAKQKTAASPQAERFGAKVAKPRARPVYVPPAPQRGGCQWIDGHPIRGQPILFCEKPATDGQGPWCDEHRSRVYVSGAAKKAALRTIASVGGKSGPGTETWGASV